MARAPPGTAPSPVPDRRHARPCLPPQPFPPRISLSDSLPLLAAALINEAGFGYPQGLYALIGHPVTWIGALISRLDRMLNRESASFIVRKAAGGLALALLLAATF